MALLNYYIWTTPDNRGRQDLLFHMVRDTMEPASNARLDWIWQLLRRKITMPFVVCCTGQSTDKPYQPYSEERKAKLRATLARNKAEKQKARLRETYPLLAEALIEQEAQVPYSKPKDRRSKYHRVKEQYRQAMNANHS